MEDKNDQDLITIVDEKGNETLYRVLFTFRSDDYDSSYILLVPSGDTDKQENVDVLAFKFNPDENGEAKDDELIDIESDEEWDMVEGVLDTFLKDENIPR